MKITCDYVFMENRSTELHHCDKDADLFILWMPTQEYMARCNKHDVNAQSPQLRTYVDAEEFIVGQVMES